MSFLKRLFGSKLLDGGSTPSPVPHAKGGSNWYFAEDKAQFVRQVVLISEPKRAVKSRYGTLLLPPHFIALTRESLSTGLLQLSGHPETFLLVRTDPMVEEVAKSTLLVAFSFFNLPTSGLVAFHVFCELKDKKIVFLEKVYGLDEEWVRDIIANAVKGDALHITHAGAGGGVHFVVDTGKMLLNPTCKYDVDIPYENDCRSVLANEWNAVLGHHRSIRKTDFQAAVQRLYELFPKDFLSLPGFVNRPQWLL
jgi:hypothetical protein